jgi:hypothetical protein
VSHWIRHISCRQLDVETPCRWGRWDEWDTINSLHAISRWPDGVAALADTEVFEELRQLAKAETYADRTQKLHTILDNITQYKARKPDLHTRELIHDRE